MKGKPLATFIPAEDRFRFRQFLLDMKQVPKTVERQMLLLPRKRVAVEAAVTLSVVRDLHGQAQGLRWLIRNDDSRAQAETERYRLLAEEVRDYAILLLDREGCVVNWNAGATSMLGYSEAEMRGKDLTAIFTPEAREQNAHRKELQKAEAEGRAEDIGWHMRKDGSRFWANGVLTALRDKDGQLRGYAKVIRDDTARRWEEERLAQVYEREHQIAATLQRALMPEIAEDYFPGLTVACEYEAAWEEALVGGDFFDVFSLHGEQVALIVGDVSGKGLAAAAHTAQVKYALRAFLRESPAPEQALARLNTLIYEDHRLSGDDNNAFVTLCVLVVHPASGRAVAAIAGAEPPLVVRADGTAQPITLQGGLLGMTPDMEYEAVHLRLASGDTTILVTDGITEARQGQDFLDYEGLARLAGEAWKAPTLPAMSRAILDGARAFAGGKLADDACLLLVRRV